MTHFEDQKEQAMESEHTDELSFEELDDVSGGIAPLAAVAIGGAAIAGICVLAGGIEGAHDAKSGKKSKYD
jgi:lactobin A/cerein 7B family class IIb bacteriocin